MFTRVVVPRRPIPSLQSQIYRSTRLYATRAANDLPRVSGAAINGPPPPRKKAGLLKKAWRVTYISAIAATALFTYTVYENRHPGAQYEQDPKKKTLVILGSGWGSCAMLKQINAEDFNVVVVSPRNYFLFTRMSRNRIAVLINGVC